MNGRRVAMLGGAIWQLARFVAVFFLVLRIGPPDDPLYHISLTWVSAGALLLCGMFLASGLQESLYSTYLPLLRIGMMLLVVTDAAVVISGSYQTLAERFSVDDPLLRLVFVSVFGIMVVDLLILAILVSYRPRHRRNAGDTEEL